MIAVLVNGLRDKFYCDSPDGKWPLESVIVQELIPHIDTTYRTTGGEDFSAVLARVPGNFFFLGARDEARGITAPHHNPHFDIDETCLPQGVAILCEAAVQALG